jgi:hypothetical protein
VADRVGQQRTDQDPHDRPGNAVNRLDDLLAGSVGADERDKHREHRPVEPALRHNRAERARDRDRDRDADRDLRGRIEPQPPQQRSTPFDDRRRLRAHDRRPREITSDQRHRRLERHGAGVRPGALARWCAGAGRDRVGHVTGEVTDRRDVVLGNARE